MTKVKKLKEIERKLMLTESPLTEKQLLHILQKTPKEHIYRRPAKGGGEWEYVTGVYVKKVLNYVFGWMWDFEVKEHGREGDLMWVLGRLTIKDKKGNPMIVKEQFGRADVKFKNEERIGKDGKKYKVKTDIPLDFGNDLKSAATDALKKCAAELGISSDIYGKEEFKEIQRIDKGFIPPIEEKKTEKIESSKKVVELKTMLKGQTDEEKIIDLKKRTGLILNSFAITEKHASILIATLLNSETQNNDKGN